MGRYYRALDGKRVVVPKDLREELNYGELSIIQSKDIGDDFPYLIVCPPGILSIFLREYDLSEEIVYRPRINSQYKINLGEENIEFIGANKEIVIIGMGKYLEIWSLEEWEEWERWVRDHEVELMYTIGKLFYPK